MRTVSKQAFFVFVSLILASRLVFWLYGHADLWGIASIKDQAIFVAYGAYGFAWVAALYGAFPVNMESPNSSSNQGQKKIVVNWYEFVAAILIWPMLLLDLIGYYGLWWHANPTMGEICRVVSVNTPYLASIFGLWLLHSLRRRGHRVLPFARVRGH